MSKRANRIAAELRRHFQPSLLQVTDDSHQHAGHSGAAPGGETHYSVLMVADGFDGQSRVARARTVHEVLAGELAGGLHALALTLRTGQEHRKITAQIPGSATAP